MVKFSKENTEMSIKSYYIDEISSEITHNSGANETQPTLGSTSDVNLNEKQQNNFEEQIISTLKSNLNIEKQSPIRNQNKNNSQGTYIVLDPAEYNNNQKVIKQNHGSFDSSNSSQNSLLNNQNSFDYDYEMCSPETINTMTGSNTDNIYYSIPYDRESTNEKGINYKQPLSSRRLNMKKIIIFGIIGVICISILVIISALLGYFLRKTNSNSLEDCLLKPCNDSSGLICNTTNKQCQCPKNSIWFTGTSQCRVSGTGNITSTSISTTTSYETTTTNSVFSCPSGYFWNVTECVSNTLKLFQKKSNLRITMLEYNDIILDFPAQVTFARTITGFNYYVTNQWNDSVVVFNQNGQYLNSIYINKPYGIQATENYLFVSSRVSLGVLYKMDHSLSIIKNITYCDTDGCLSHPELIIYDKAMDRLYVNGVGTVFVFNQNFSLVGKFSFKDLPITSINIYNNRIYLGNQNTLMIYENNFNTRNLTNVCSKKIWSMFFPSNTQMIVACADSLDKVYLYDMEGQQVGTTIDDFDDNILYVDADPFGRLVVCMLHKGVWVIS